jgi:hypothetical protein
MSRLSAAGPADEGVAATYMELNVHGAAIRLATEAYVPLANELLAPPDRPVWITVFVDELENWEITSGPSLPAGGGAVRPVPAVGGARRACDAGRACRAGRTCRSLLRKQRPVGRAARGIVTHVGAMQADIARSAQEYGIASGVGDADKPGALECDRRAGRTSRTSQARYLADPGGSVLVPRGGTDCTCRAGVFGRR